jgi:DME family drug/metabolite transporter
MIAQAERPAERWQGLPLIIAAAVMWGTIGPATKGLFQISDATPLSIGLLRPLIALPALLAATILLLGPQAFRIKRRDLGVMACIGLVMSVYQVAFVAAVGQVGVTVATLITLCSVPVIVALLSGLFLGERLTRRVLLALAIAVGGAVLLVGSPTAEQAGSSPVRGALLALLSAMGYATMTLVGRLLAGRYHPLQPITVGVAVSALALLPIALASGFVLSYTPAGWALLLHLGLVPTALAYVLFFFGMRSTTATIASIVTLVEPLTAAILGWAIFGERLGPLSFLGAAMLVAAMLILSRRER